MAYLIFAVVLAAILISLVSLRHRSPDDPTKTVASFQRSIKALNPNRKVGTSRKS
ncbi:MAG TPA: hypothetical protein VND22_09525 [Actinomycetota bacterium]|nr:hypothetical protein [Actinomycetota bacterium]